MKTTIASDVKFKINFPQQIFLHHNTAMEVSSLYTLLSSSKQTLRKCFIRILTGHAFHVAMSVNVLPRHALSGHIEEEM